MGIHSRISSTPSPNVLAIRRRSAELLAAAHRSRTRLDRTSEQLARSATAAAGGESRAIAPRGRTGLPALPSDLVDA